MRWKCVVMCQVYMCERVMVYVDVAVWTLCWVVYMYTVAYVCTDC